MGKARVLRLAAVAVALLTAGSAVQAAEWVRETVPGAPRHVNGIAAIDAENAWAVGDEGLILRRQGGVWQEINIPVIAQQAWDFHGLEFVDNRNGWIVGEKNVQTDKPKHTGIVLRTVNGGSSWHAHYPMLSPQYPPTPFYDVHFLDDRRGWIAAGNGYVLRTLSAGDEWDVELVSSFPDHLQGIWAANEDTAWACGDAFGTLAKTEDGGANWDVQEPFDKQYVFPQVGSKDCKRANAALWASNFDTAFVGLSEGKVGRTTDGGGSWEALSVRGTSTWFRDVWSRGAKVWAVGTSGAIMYSADGGSTWREEHGLSPYHLNSVELVPGSGAFCGWAVGTVDTTDNSITILRRVGRHDPDFSYGPSPKPSSVAISWEVDPNQPIQYFKLNRSFNNCDGEPFDFEATEPFSPGVGTYGYTDYHSYSVQWSYYYWLDLVYEDGTCERHGPYEVPGFGSLTANLPPAPRQLHAQGTPSSVILTWDHVGPYAYHVYRSEVPSGLYEHMGSTHEAFYEDGTALEGVTYFYKVKSELDGLPSQDSPLATAGAGSPPRFDETVQPDSSGIYYDVRNQVAYFGWLPVHNFSLGGYWVSLNLWGASRALSNRASLQRLWWGYEYSEPWTTGTKLCYGALAMDRSGVMGSAWEDRELPVGVCNAITDEATLGNNASRFVRRGARLDALFSDSLGTSYDIYHAYSSDGGLFWSEPELIGSGKYPALARKGENLYAVWTDVSGRNLYFSSHKCNNWTSPIPLIEAGPPMTAPSFVVDNLPGRGWGHLATERRAWGNSHQVIYAIMFDPDGSPAIDSIVSIDSYSSPHAPQPPPTASIACTELRRSSLVGIAYRAYKKPSHGKKQWDIYLGIPTSGGITQYRISQDKQVLDSRNPCLDASCGSAQIAWEQQDTEHSDRYKVICWRAPFAFDGLPDTSLALRYTVDEGPGNNAHQPRIMGNAAVWTREMDDTLGQDRVYFDVMYSTFKCDTFTYLEGQDLSQLWWAPSRYPQLHLEPACTDGLLLGLWTEGFSPHAWIRYERVPLPHPIAKCIYKMGGEKLSPITVERDGVICWGEESFAKVDYSTSALRYCLTDLDPATTYCIGAAFYQESGSTWEQRLSINGNALSLRIPSGELVYDDSALPVDGVSSINITVERMDGDTGILSYIALFEVDGDDGGGGAQSATATPLPHSLTLLQNYPNPFGHSTTISYHVTRGHGDAGMERRGSRIQDPASHITLRLYDLTGRLIRTLIDEPSSHPTIQLSNRVIWDARDDGGKAVPSGVYFCRLKMGDQSRSRRLVLLR